MGGTAQLQQKWALIVKQKLDGKVRRHDTTLWVKIQKNGNWMPTGSGQGPSANDCRTEKHDTAELGPYF